MVSSRSRVSHYNSQRPWVRSPVAGPNAGTMIRPDIWLNPRAMNPGSKWTTSKRPGGWVRFGDLDLDNVGIHAGTVLCPLRECRADTVLCRRREYSHSDGTAHRITPIASKIESPGIGLVWKGCSCGSSAPEAYIGYISAPYYDCLEQGAVHSHKMFI